MSASLSPWPEGGLLEPDSPLSLREKLSSFVRAARYDASFDRIAGADQVAPINCEGKLPTVFGLHGFCATPAEIELAADVAKSLGLRVHFPILPGHGTRPSALRAYDFDALVREIRPTFNEVRREGPVILLGMSMGTLIATELCLSAPGDVLGLVYISNAFWLKKPFPSVPLRWTRRLGIPDFGILKTSTDLGDPEARRTQVSYRIQPSSVASEIELAGARLAGELFRVHRPTLILHGERDEVCPVSNASRVARLIGTDDVRVVTFPASKHILCRDREKSAVRAELDRFFRRFVSPSK